MEWNVIGVAASAIVFLAALGMALRAFLRPHDGVAERKVRWPWLVTGVIALAIGVALWGNGNDNASPILYCIAGVVGAVLSWMAARELTEIVLGEHTTPKFKQLAGTGVGALAALSGAILAAMAASWHQPIDALNAHGFFENNFEFFLISAGAWLVVLSSWIAKAWANSLSLPECAETRRRTAMDVTMLFACIVAVSVFVAIGASAFAARLAQRQIDTARGADTQGAGETQVSGETLHDAVRRVIRLQEAFEAISIEDDAAQAEDKKAAFWNAVEPFSIRLNVTRPVGTPEFHSDSAAMIANLERASRVATGDQGISLRDMEALRRARNEALAADERATRDLSQKATIGDELESTYAGLARAICMGRSDLSSDQASRAATPNDQTAPQPSARDAKTMNPACQEGDKFQEANRKGRYLVGVIRPLYRSPMSEVLARRAPIILSIELVLVMGALGVLIQVISSLLSNLTRSEPPAKPMTLLRLGLQILFGAATALAMFVLLNIAVDATSLTSGTGGETPHGDDLNPFAMAALGLLGGFGALRVAAWMDNLSEMAIRIKRLENRDST